MATARESRRLRRASRGRGEAEENGRREDDAKGEDNAQDEEQSPSFDDSGGGVISTLKDTAADAALAVLKPVAKRAATKAAKFAVEKGPQLFEDKVMPMMDDAGGPMGLVSNLAEGGGPAGALMSKLTGGGDDEDGGGDAGDGTGQGRRMPIQQAVDVAAPIDIVYDQFTQFEDFPKFMHRVESVEQKDDATVVFNEKIWGIRRRWEAEIVEQRPDERIVWESVSGMQHVGVVTFHELADRLTRIELNIDIDPSGPIEKIARGARFAKRAARADLKRFKAYVEMHEDETGAWRGEIQDGEVVTEDGEYDEQYEDEPEAEYEEEEPEAETEEEPEAETEDEPEDEVEDAEAEDEDEEEEQEEEEEEQPAARRRSSSRSSSNGSSKSESASPKRSRASSSRGRGGSNGSSKSKSTASKSGSSRSRGSSKSSSSSGSKSSSSGSKSSSSKSSSSRSRGSSKSGSSSGKSRAKASSSKS
jgi:uncharacterized membrane protein